MAAAGERLSENYVQDSFHSYLKSSLTQAKAERLLDAELLSSAEGDLMITGPALCLYFAALRSTTNPPSVPLPRSTKSSDPQELSLDNCPPAFTPFFRVWSNTVPRIQSLPPEHQHDLARIICNLPPIALQQEERVRVLAGVAADLRAVAIEISQRRSFQERYGEALQAAIDSGPGVKVKASFVPPPVYDPSPVSSAPPSPRPASLDLPPPSSPTRASHHPIPSHPRPQSPNLLSPYPPIPSSSPSPTSPTFPSPLSSPTTSLSPRAPSPSPSSPSTSIHRSRSPSPSILTDTSPAIEFIRETLYASLYDVLSRTPSLLLLLQKDPPRAYFASVAFAVLDTTSRCLTPDGSAVISVLGQKVTLEMCPRGYRPFMKEFFAIGMEARGIEEEDTRRAMELAQRGREVPEPRMERVKRILEKGVGDHLGAGGEGGEDRRKSVEGRAVAFANRVNALSLGISRLKAFRERQDEVFKVLGGLR